MKQYKNRIADKILEFKLESKGAVLIEGTKWCGKTTTAKQFAKSVISMQEPDNLSVNIELANIKPSALLIGKTPRLIDEWQVAPKLWDAVRYEVDTRDEFGQFILTGSAVPVNISELSHTGTGRITRMLMRPMSLYESEDSTGTVSLNDIFAGNLDIAGTSSIDFEYLAFLMCRGGWPKALDCSERVALEQAFDYFDGVVNSDISRVDNVERNKERASRIIRSYARAVAGQTKLSSIIKDIAVNEVNNISDDTVASYIKALKQIFVIEDSLAWNPNLRSKAAIRTSDTHYFVDPSIGTAALGLGPQDLINDLRTMGLLFENMCIRDLRIYADMLNGQVYHYRDSNNLECDAVIHLRNGAYGLVEIKLGGDNLIEEGAKTLNKLAANIDTDRMKPPSFKMIITGIGNYAYRRKDGILLVPIGSLKD
ncbi:MAG: DUF4143 domain-containing protein [Alphaproteobacteria bacterium]|nr:DUF4143 domain-containing protein [Alphaproteobacteria bacterium]MDY4689398.1 DUF4143 domain-containing protein [Alphaproteobacteria bacterium]